MKKAIIIIIGVLIIILLILLGIKGCEKFRRPDEEIDETQETPITETFPEISSENFNSQGEEMTAFILANSEFLCEFLNNPELEEDEEESENLVKKTYKKYNFPVENDEVMYEILRKYENNQEVIETIQENVKDC